MIDLPFELTDALRAAMIEHAAREAPRECCGLVLRAADDGAVRYQACRNVRRDDEGAESFVLHPEDYAFAEDCGTVLSVVHSHPNASANPSMADRVGCERSALPWLVVGWPSGVVCAVAPEGWQAPYLGREFHHGVLDCYTLIQDWYRRELDIELPDFERDDGWWERGQSLYRDGFAAAGFAEVSGEPRTHDVILMQVRSDVENHGAIYQGEGLILHHLYGRPSGRDVYGGYWLRHTRALLRHRSLL